MYVGPSIGSRRRPALGLGELGLGLSLSRLSEEPRSIEHLHDWGLKDLCK